MGELNFGKRECRGALEKIGAKPRTSKESNAWYELDGKLRFRITVPKGKSGELGTGTKKSIVNQFHLTNEEFAQLYKCTLTGPEYKKRIRQKVTDGLL